MNEAPNTNTSATGGYLLPAQGQTTPNYFTLDDFLQSVIVGITGLPGDLVRPKWQPNPPKQPDLYTNWIAFAAMESDADTNAFMSLDPNTGVNIFQRIKTLDLQCSFYGPQSLAVAEALRDGLQVNQNLEALEKAKMSFVSTSRLVRAPDLINERWVNRWEMTVYLRYETLRTYPILTFLSASGTLYVQNGTTKTIPIVAGVR